MRMDEWNGRSSRTIRQQHYNPIYRKFFGVYALGTVLHCIIYGYEDKVNDIFDQKLIGTSNKQQQ